MLKNLEAMAMDARLFQSPDQSFNQPILLLCVGGDEFLLHLVYYDYRYTQSLKLIMLIAYAMQFMNFTPQKCTQNLVLDKQYERRK